MKRIPIFLTAFLLLFTVQVYADDKGTEYWLKKLDESLEKHNEYEQKRIDRIKLLKEQLEKATGNDESYNVTRQLYDEYKSYCYDSAVVYARQMGELAEAMGDRNRIGESKCALVFCLTSAGILNEAYNVLSHVDTTAMDMPLKIEYNYVGALFWRSMADFVREKSYYTKYITKSNAMLDTLMSITPPETTMWYSYHASHLMRELKFSEALQNQEKVMEASDVSTHLKAQTMAEMAWAYLGMENETKAIECFAQSAIYDNESATREITALYHLSRLIYKQGDYDRASQYVHQALADVSFYNSRLRKIEISEILPIIEQDRYDALRSERNWLMAAVGLAVLLLLAIVSSYFMVRRKNRKLSEAHKTIDCQLHQLQKTNSQLTEANKIKNEYIGRSFYTNAEFIKKIEKLYLAIDRKIATHQYEDLRSTLKQSALNTERESMYESFDQTFLKLFPQFVEKYNLLFEEKDRRMPANENSLTSEMRIFALIRLGINDSERIANFLDYSVHTVNTYKTRIKNRALCENDQFEHLIMEI